MQNLEPLLIFTTVAEMGSFTHAAESLGIQKGRASTAVRKLEEVVGVCLRKSMTYTRCSQAIVWHFADVCGSTFRPRWRA